MRIKLEGIKFNLTGNETREGRDKRDANVEFELGSFEYELSVEEAIELAKLSGMTVKEILGTVSDLATKAIQYKKEENTKLLEENLSLRIERDNLKSKIKMEESKKEAKAALDAMKQSSSKSNDDGEDSYI